MEDKTPNNQDDELKSGSSEDNQEESEDFGLPEASTDNDSSFEEDSDPLPAPDESDSDMFNDVSEDEDLEESHVYKYQSTQDDRKRNPIGLIISFVLIGVIIIAIAIYWFFFREPVKKQVVQQPVVEEVEQSPVIEDKPPVDPAPEIPRVIEETPVESETYTAIEEGSFEAINDRTGRYYVVLNSFIDGDLAKDYAQNLATDGIDTKIIPPSEIKKGFHRVVLSNDYGSWQSAEASLGELKGIFGETIWVLKY